MRGAVMMAASIIAAGATPVLANKPVPPKSAEERLCARNAYLIVAGRALKAASVDERYRDIGLSLRIDRVIWADPFTSGWTRRPGPNDVIEAGQSATAVPLASGRSYRIEDDGYMQFNAPSNAVLSPEVITSAYTGTDFIFWLFRGKWLSNPLGGPETYRYHARILPLDREDWMRRTMAEAKAVGRECPALIAP